MSAPRYDDADRERDGFTGDADGLDPAGRDSLHRIFTAGVEDETGTAAPGEARNAARALRTDKTGSDEKGSTTAA